MGFQGFRGGMGKRGKQECLPPQGRQARRRGGGSEEGEVGEEGEDEVVAIEVAGDGVHGWVSVWVSRWGWEEKGVRGSWERESRQREQMEVRRMIEVSESMGRRRSLEEGGEER